MPCSFFARCQHSCSVAFKFSKKRFFKLSEHQFSCVSSSYSENLSEKGHLKRQRGVHLKRCWLKESSSRGKL